MRKVHLYIALSALLFSLLLNVFLAGVAAKAEHERADKCPINWRNTSNFSVRDTVYIHDTVRIIAPTPTSETLLGYDTVSLERADKRADIGIYNSGYVSEVADIGLSNDACDLTCNLAKDSAPDIAAGLPNAHLTDEVSKEEQADSATISDSAMVVIPITERVYKDSTYKAVVRGYNPELVSLDIYNRTLYYPVVEKVEVKPKVAIVVGPYFGVDGDGLSFGLSITLGMPIWQLSWKNGIKIFD